MYANARFGRFPDGCRNRESDALQTFASGSGKNAHSATRCGDSHWLLSTLVEDCAY